MRWIIKKKHIYREREREHNINSKSTFLTASTFWLMATTSASTSLFFWDKRSWTVSGDSRIKISPTWVNILYVHLSLTKYMHIWKHFRTYYTYTCLSLIPDIFLWHRSIFTVKRVACNYQHKLLCTRIWNIMNNVRCRPGTECCPPPQPWAQTPPRRWLHPRGSRSHFP